MSQSTVTTAPAEPAAAVPASAPRRPTDPRTILLIGAVVAAVALAASLVGLAVDHRVIQGAPAWLKPMKFGVSITVYLVTLRWMLGFVQGHRRLLTVFSSIVLVTLVAEIVGIDMQVVRGTTSHFNESTAFDGAVYDTMGGLISVLFVAMLVLAVVLVRVRGLDAGIAAGLRWGVLLSVLGMAEAVLMTVNFGWSDGGGHTVGAPDGGPGLPLTDWSTLHGDLRIGHFVGLHALQLFPILAWAVRRWTPFSARRRAALLRVGGAGYAGLIALVTWQALRGQSIVRPDALTIAAFVLLVLLVAACVAAVLRRSDQTVTVAVDSSSNIPRASTVAPATATGIANTDTTGIRNAR